MNNPTLQRRWSFGVVVLLCEYAIDRRAAETEARRNRARRLAAGMRALRQSGFRVVQCPPGHGSRDPDLLDANETTCRFAALDGVGGEPELHVKALEELGG